MIIKSFMAPTVAGALKMIREHMGGEAVILKTRLCSASEAALSGNRVEVTACVDESVAVTRKAGSGRKSVEEKKVRVDSRPAEVVAGTNLSGSGDNYDFAAMLEKKLDFILNSQRTAEPSANIDSRLQPIYLNLIDADLPVEIARQLIADIESNLHDNNPDQVACRVLSAELKGCIADEVVLTSGMKVIFVGPSGAGKTSALAKLAAELSVGRGQKVTLSSLDHVKVSAYEEIGGYAELLGLPLDLSERSFRKRAKDSILLIDTPSLTCRGDRQAELLEKIRQVQPDVIFFTFSVCNRTRDLIDSINIFESLSPTYLVASHLDETERWGGILAMARYLETPLAYVTDAPGGKGGLVIPDAGGMARRTLKLEEGEYVE